VILFNSRGEVTSYGPDVKRRWQLRTDASWQRRDDVDAGYGGGGGGGGGHLETFPLAVDGASEVVVALGAARGVVLSPGGYKIATLRLPSVPIAPVLIVDVNGDGLNDIVARTALGTYCWTQRGAGGGGPLLVLLGFLIVGMVVAFASQVRSIQTFFTHRPVSTFDRFPFQLTDELFLYGMALIRSGSGATGRRS
jgi:hypothetical protein